MSRAALFKAAPLLLLAPLFSGCQAAPASAQPRPQAAEALQVRLAKVEQRDLAPPIRATGLTVAKEQATLGFKIGGVVARILVQPGDAVRPGQLLAALDTSEIDAQVRQAEAALEKARRDQARASQLFSVQAATKQSADDAETGLHVAEQNVAIARFNREHALLVASGAGRVARRLVEPNSVVGPGTPILQVNMAGSGYVVRAGLVDRDVVRIAPGGAAEVTLDAFPNQRFAARIAEISVEPSPLSGVYDVELRLDAPPPRLVSGMMAKVDLQPAAAQRYAVVPVEAVVEGDGLRASVFTIDGGRAHKRPIETAFVFGKEVAVRSGLERVDQVVTEGAPWLTEGAAVREVTP